MPTRSLLVLAGVLLSAAACRDETVSPTEPTWSATGPEAAVISNTWLVKRDLWTNQYSDFAAATVTDAAGQSTVYVIGGRSSTFGSLGKVMAYTVASNTWSAKAPLPISLYRSNGAAVINGRIYISGGVRKYKSYQDRLYVYDPAANSWTAKHVMPTNGFDGLTGVINNQLYVVTGCHSQEEDCGLYYPGGDHPDRWLFRYDPPTDTWTELAVPPFFGAPVGGTIGGKLFLGVPGSSVLHVYDPATNLWTERPIPRVIRSGSAFVTLGAKLYMIGGYQGVTAVRTTSVYDPATNAWTNKAPLPTARAWGAAARVVVGGQIGIELVAGARPGNNLQYRP
ncbi:MAG TPA: hypothetical protein VHR43_03035 [Gemmatimonadales bacterium]|nr:hypothetical protein [Gemmatimonadales bacterium]